MSSEPCSESHTIQVGHVLGEVGRATEEFQAFAVRIGLAARVIHRTAVILDEVLNNIVQYSDGDASVEVALRCVEGRLVVTISDCGAEFDPLIQEAPDTSASLVDREVGGLGIHLVRKLADEVSYARESGRNILTVTQRLDAASESS